MNEVDRLRALLPLYDSEELTPEERAQVEAWLQRESAAREELQALRALQEQLQQAGTYEPATATLGRLRAKLVDKLEADTTPRSLWQAWFKRQLAPGQVLPRFAFALAGLLLGVFVGRQFFASVQVPVAAGITPEILPMLLAQQPITTARSVLDPHLANVHAIRLDPATGQIEMEFSTVSNVALRGSADDPMVQLVLAHALRQGEQAGLRLRAVKALGEITPAQITRQPDNELTGALVYVLRHDTNAGVRLKAIEVLKKLPVTQPVKEALIQTLLRDANAAVRVQAIEALSHYQPAAEKISVLETAAASDTNGYVRLQAVRLLEAIRPQLVH